MDEVQQKILDEALNVVKVQQVQMKRCLVRMLIDSAFTQLTHILASVGFRAANGCVEIIYDDAIRASYVFFVAQELLPALYGCF